MESCPLCGEKNNNEDFSFGKFTIASPCNGCRTKLQRLTTPVPDEIRSISLNWAKEIIETKYNPPATDALKAIYSLSLSGKTDNKAYDVRPVTFSKASPKEDSVFNPFKTEKKVKDIKVSLRRTATVEIIVKFLFALIILSGLIGGFAVGGFIGMIIGIFAAALSGGLVYSFIMMFIEISENTAVQAKSTLRTEQMISEMNERDKIAKGINK